ncbi:MAG: N-acetyl-alpha-D-glucosaminyl L-malate synthase BshA [Psychroflexus sp.]|nr:N-acetyl-alpha-D-glucosaminyl L-malate synthase BshA [Psychroflexus sp.]MDR9448208.1 N-acetyl-alpha-D-glucosaminyl L-malate synthase BshA [Psychroflexus sp.]
MKIAIVCYPTYGGSGIIATELGIELANRGHEIHFITYKQPVRLAYLSKNIHYHQVIIQEYPLFHYQPYELALSSKLTNTIKTYDIDLLHVHYAIPHAYAGLMAQQMLMEDNIKIPMITTLHGTDITLVGSHPFYKPAVNFSINKSDIVTAVSEDLRKNTLEIFDIKNEIYHVPNFVNIAKVTNNFKDCDRELMANSDEKIITHVSNLRKVKRVKDVIKVFAKIHQKQKSKLIIVGDGPERESATQLAYDLDVRKNILFLGKSDEIDKILCFSDLFLLPSEKESFGLSALEAMAHGVPVISTNTGGIPEVNKDGYSGFLSDVGDVDDMAKNALSLLQNEEKLQLFKNQAREVAESYDLGKVLPGYLKLYEKALAL